MGRSKVRLVVSGAVVTVALMTLSPASSQIADRLDSAKAGANLPNMTGGGFVELGLRPNEELTAPTAKAHHNFKLYCPPEGTVDPMPDDRNHLHLHGNVAGNYQFKADVITVTDCDDVNGDGRPDRVEGRAEGTCNGVPLSDVPDFEFTDNEGLSGGGPVDIPGELSSSRMSVPQPGGTAPPPEDSVFYDLMSADPACNAAEAAGPIDGGSHKGHK